MVHSEILKNNIWKYIRETVSLWYQCVAWAKVYCKLRWYSIRSFGWSAINGWITWSPFDDTWKKVIYTWFNSPKEGDVIFWKQGIDGHVAIANKFCYPFLFRYTDQNWGWNEEPIQPRWSSWKNIVGWYTRIK